MPIPAEYETIISSLEKGTRERRVKWQDGKHRVFVAFPKYSLSIWPYTEIDDAHNDSGPSGMAMGLMNENGQRIDSFALENNDKDFVRLEALYTIAVRVAMRIDVTLEDLARQLESQGDVGEEPTRRVPF